MSVEQPPKNLTAPDFTLQDTKGNPWKLSEQLEHTKKLVLVFYRGDW